MERRHIHARLKFIMTVTCLGAAGLTGFSFLVGFLLAAGQTSPKVKYASAQDLRRSFGDRWSRRIMPRDLRELMRHADIQTTMGYYVGQNASATAAVLWDAYGRQLGAPLGTRRPEGVVEKAAAIAVSLDPA